MPGQYAEVHGAAELIREFARINKRLRPVVRKALQQAGAPVAETAERLASQEIPGMGTGRWGKMRIGVTHDVVYVAPRSRRRSGSPRPNLAPLLLERAMEPAVEENALTVEHVLGRAIDILTAEF